MIFVKYNQALKAHYNRRDVVDPISLDDIDESNEWLVGKMSGATNEENAEDEMVFVDDSDGLTWGAVAKASSVGAPTRNTRNHTKSMKSKGSTSTSQLHLKDLDDDFDDYEMDVEGYTFGYNDQSVEDLGEEQKIN